MRASWEGGLAVVVACAGTGLVTPSPAGPVQDERDAADRSASQAREQALGFGQSHRHEVGLGVVVAAFAGGHCGQEGVGKQDQGGPPIP